MTAWAYGLGEKITPEDLRTTALCIRDIDPVTAEKLEIKAESLEIKELMERIAKENISDPEVLAALTLKIQLRDARYREVEFHG
jgi:chorismate mutase